jgi:hypothetical protein
MAIADQGAPGYWADDLWPWPSGTPLKAGVIIVERIVQQGAREASGPASDRG